MKGRSKNPSSLRIKPDLLSEERLRTGLQTRWLGKKIYTFDTIDSTNNCAKALASCWADQGTVVIAEQQTAGRGRLGRTWEANPSENLTFSIILRPDVTPEGLNLLPLYAAVAVAAAVEQATGLRVECKWPNDLLIGGKKFAGILLEGSLSQGKVEYVVIGIGINVNQSRFSADLSGRATSLSLAAGHPVDRVALFRTILASLEEHHRRLAEAEFQSVLPLWLSRAPMMNRQISVSTQGSVLSGIVTGLTPQGALVVNSGGKELTFFAGDVTILK